MNLGCCEKRDEDYYVDNNGQICSVFFIADVQILQKKLVNSIEKSLYNIIATIYQNRTEIDFKILEDYKDNSVSALFNVVSKGDLKNETEICLLKLLFLCKWNEQKFQRDLEQLNEKSEKQKKNGVYYTPEDTVNYIINNAIELYNKKNVKDILSVEFLDPTCGTGAFLLQVLELKLKSIECSEKNICGIISTIYGNDRDDFSIFILKLRYIYKLCRYTVSLNKIWQKLDRQFFVYDFITDYSRINKKFDIVIGNPPYVESSKSDVKESCVFGNLYADVVNNSLSLLKNKGIFGYIIPLSYISTPRFEDLRKSIAEKTSEEYISSFADRPDCLFAAVHQKLNIILAIKEKSKKHKVFTSDYCYWYKQEREKIFNEITYIENPYVYDDFYAKIGNDIELSIFDKVICQEKELNLDGIGNSTLFLNMRATFWIKSFTENGDYSKEYKQFMVDEKDASFLHILFSSSLFWWFWVKVSDCWHITMKDLKMFKLPSEYNFDVVKELSAKLTNKLEGTKVYVNTKQTLYEYKHKECKDIIDLIDDYIGKLYGLDLSEVNYLKTYNIKYRMGQKDEL